ncbi:TadE/TadG family type IV pilus assembly protein [Phenylobacterium sp.]|jgi:Flp pilus assembly protein TadG|uniref:TadE/TadG family type IV pilus assembly protein n=1 Tax=Phenylobacterium sp. TaxID=1871053 RepID=UPI002F949595
MRQPLPSLWGDRSGATAVETAMLLPALIALLLGVMETGRMAWTQAALTFAVQEASRCAAVRTDLCGSSLQIQTFAAQKVAALNVPTSAFTVTPGAACGREVSARLDSGFLVYTLAPSAPALTARACRP